MAGQHRPLVSGIPVAPGDKRTPGLTSVVSRRPRGVSTAGQRRPFDDLFQRRVAGGDHFSKNVDKKGWWLTSFATSTINRPQPPDCPGQRARTAASVRRPSRRRSGTAASTFFGVGFPRSLRSLREPLLEKSTLKTGRLTRFARSRPEQISPPPPTAPTADSKPTAASARRPSRRRSGTARRFRPSRGRPPRPSPRAATRPVRRGRI